MVVLVVFNKFENQWEIEGKIVLESPLYIGTQYSESTSTSVVPLLMQYDAASDTYRPFIPGSSLKGVLRATAERILETHGMGLKMAEELFGGKESASKIRVRDAPCHDFHTTEERLHAAGIVKRDKDTNRYFLTRSKPRLYFLENVPINSCFDFRIHVDNASEREIALLLRALDEMTYKRATIGGGVSRGHGFVSVNEIKIKLKKRQELLVKEEELDKKSVMEALKLATNGTGGGFENFKKYAAATTKELEGCVVCEAVAVCDTDFYLEGVEEKMVTGDGHPVIPGSTIKGFLRHACYVTSDRSIGEKLKWDANKVDIVFGSNERRSRVLISEAFNDEIPPGDFIPKGSRLRCWIVFDNLERENISQLINLLSEKNQITGNQSTRGPNKRGEPPFNEVHFEFKRAWKYHVENPFFEL